MIMRRRDAETLGEQLTNTTASLEDALTQLGVTMEPARVRGLLRVVGVDRCQCCGRWRRASLLSMDLVCYPTCNTKEDCAP